MCFEANLPCDTQDNTTGSALPQSIVRFLEGYIASLEGESEGIHTSTLSPNDNALGDVDEVPRRGKVYLHPSFTAAGAVMHAIAPPYIGLATDLLIPRCAFRLPRRRLLGRGWTCSKCRRTTICRLRAIPRPYH